MQMEEILNLLRKRLPRNGYDLLTVMLSALGKKLEDIQLHEETMSSGAILWIAR
jgi:hypothetical protein